MKLLDYIVINNLKVIEFARSIGISRVSIHGFLRGSRKPSLRTKKKIEIATNGIVSMDDWE